MISARPAIGGTAASRIPGMPDIDWDEQVNVFWAVESEACGHIGLAARDRGSMQWYLNFLPDGWRLVHPTRRQLKDAHDDVQCAKCELPELTVRASE
jgi:hypothetical protein